jgi:hypothetical protein
MIEVWYGSGDPTVESDVEGPERTFRLGLAVVRYGPTAAPATLADKATTPPATAATTAVRASADTARRRASRRSERALPVTARRGAVAFCKPVSEFSLLVLAVLVKIVISESPPVFASAIRARGLRSVHRRR